VDKKYRIVNNNKIIDVDAIYNNLEYIMGETDIGGHSNRNNTSVLKEGMRF
jgi:hypothetical protein